MKTVFSSSTFAREIGFESAAQKGFRKTVTHLARIGALEIQQGGFKGDNMHHKKLIVVRDFRTVMLYLGAKIEEAKPKQRNRKASRKKVEPYGRRFSVSEWDIIAKLDEVVTLPVSARGEGMCFYLPKDLCELYGFICGDRIQVALKKHFRKRREEE